MTAKRAKSKGIEAKLVIIGGGGAGLSAALTAAEMGATGIIVVEKRRSPGGNTALAGGLFACESPVQARERIIADRDFLFKKAMDWAHWSRIDPTIIRAFLGKSGDTIRWLEEKGLEFNLIRFYPDQQPPVQHNPRGNGAKLVKVLVQNCRDRGVQMLLQTSCKKIVRGKNGKIAGVIVAKGDEEIVIRAACVIIATGGFAGNHGLLKKYFPSYCEGLSLGGLPLTGDGLFLAEETGAAIEDFATMIKEGPRFDPRKWPLMFFERDPATIWVNKEGKRFIDEKIGYHVFESVNAMLRQPDKVSFALFDTTIRKLFDSKMPGLEQALKVEADKGRVKIAGSWDEMASWIGAEPGVLKNTISQYNVFCHQGYDDDFAKERRYLKSLETPPYYAIRGMAVMLDTVGGIRINERMEVLDRQNNPIPGLYAAGVVTSGWESEIYCSDLSASAFGFAINSGRIAGENAVRHVNDYQ
jgi:fumarate reductase flavoprotein subunit